MLSLILKDILIQKKSIFAILIYPLIGILAFGSSFGISAGYVISIVSMGYIMLRTVSGYDEKNKFDIVLNSLPIRREDAVTAKYLSVITFLIIATFISGAAGAVLKFLSIFKFIEIIKISDILMAACALCIYYSLYIPLDFKFGAIKMRYINMFIYLALIFIPIFILSAVKQNPDNHIIQFIISLSKGGPYLEFAAAAILFIISMEISMKIYRNKEF